MDTVTKYAQAKAKNDADKALAQIAASLSHVLTPGQSMVFNIPKQGTIIITRPTKYETITLKEAE